MQIFRKNFLKNPVIIVDGSPGSGKGIISRLLSYFENVEMFREKPEYEVILPLFQLGALDLNAAKFLVQAISDQDIYNQSILRHANIKPSDLSSITKFPRKIEYLKRLISNDLGVLEDNFRSSNKAINYFTHNMTTCIEPAFSALEERLLYIRAIRSPFTEYMLNLSASWVKRWENDYRNTLPLVSLGNKEKCMPFFLPKEYSELYLKSDAINRAALSLSILQKDGDKKILELKKKYKTNVIEVPFERFVLDPSTFLDWISNQLGTNVNKPLINFLKKERIPRSNLNDAPFSKYYFKNGWRKTDNKLSPNDELKLYEVKAKQLLNEEVYSIVKDCSNSYNNKYGIEEF